MRRAIAETIAVAGGQHDGALNEVGTKVGHMRGRATKVPEQRRRARRLHTDEERVYGLARRERGREIQCGYDWKVIRRIHHLDDASAKRRHVLDEKPVDGITLTE